MSSTRQDDAEQFLRYASEYCHAAHHLLHDITPFLFHPTFYCALHAIELSLKASLALAGVSRRRLASKTLGHDLEALLKEAIGCHALGSSVLNRQEQRIVARGGKHYSAKCFEYPEFMVSTHAIGEWLFIANKLIEDVTNRITPKAYPTACSSGQPSR